MKNKLGITIKDVALKAGVCTATVSNIFNNTKGMVSEETRKRVFSVAEDLGYRPDRKARMLKPRGCGVVSIHIDSPVFFKNSSRQTYALTMLEVQGIISHLYRKGYEAHLLMPGYGKDKEEIFKQIIKEKSCDGFVILGCSTFSDDDVDEILRGLSAYKIPLVTRDKRLIGKGVSGVSINVVPAVRSACSAIKKYGHENIVYMGNTQPLSVKESESRLTTFRRELAEFGLSIPDQNVFQMKTEVEACLVTLRLIRERKKSLPTCIIHSSDHMAMAGIAAIMESGLKVPEDISVIGSDNAPYATASQVPLASINIMHFDVGVTLAKTLLSAIDDDEPSISGVIYLNAEFIKRESIGPAKQKGCK